MNNLETGNRFALNFDFEWV